MELRRVQTFSERSAPLDGSAAQQAALKAALRVMADAHSSDAAPQRPGPEAEADGEATALPPAPPLEMPDLRLSLLARLHRACHARRMQGLLSAQVTGRWCCVVHCRSCAVGISQIPWSGQPCRTERVQFTADSTSCARGMLQGLRTLEYCLNRAGESPDQPLTVWGSFLAKEVQVRQAAEDSWHGVVLASLPHAWHAVCGLSCGSACNGPARSCSHLGHANGVPSGCHCRAAWASDLWHAAWWQLPVATLRCPAWRSVR